MKKTCWYTTVLPLRVGALVGSRGTAELDPMIEFGFHLGAAFQIRDDILNLVGDPALYGKEPLGDLLEGKRTLMLIHLLAGADPADRRWLVDLPGRDPTERHPEDVVRVLELMQSYGSIAFASEFATGVARSALDLHGCSLRRPRRHPGAPLHRLPRAVHDRARQLNEGGSVAARDGYHRRARRPPPRPVRDREGTYEARRTP